MLRKLLIITCLCLPLLSFSKKKKKQAPPAQQTVVDNTDYRQINAQMPSILVVTPEGKHVTNDMVKNDANLFLMMFNPTCEHCEEMTASIVKNIALFKRSKVVMIAAPMMGPYMKDFQKNFKINEHPELVLGLDSGKTIDRLFNYNTLPQVNIYNHERRLIRTINAQESVDSLRKYIE